MRDNRFLNNDLDSTREVIDTLTNFAVYQQAQRWVAEDAAVARAGKVICAPYCDGTYHLDYAEGGYVMCPINEKIRDNARKSVR